MVCVSTFCACIGNYSNSICSSIRICPLCCKHDPPLSDALLDGCCGGSGSSGSSSSSPASSSTRALCCCCCCCCRTAYSPQKPLLIPRPLRFYSGSIAPAVAAAAHWCWWFWSLVMKYRKLLCQVRHCHLLQVQQHQISQRSAVQLIATTTNGDEISDIADINSSSTSSDTTRLLSLLSSLLLLLCCCLSVFCCCCCCWMPRAFCYCCCFAVIGNCCWGTAGRTAFPN